MNRYDELNILLEKGRYFKVVCGAGNEDPEEVYRLSLVYTLAGANAIDVSANVEVVEMSMQGIAHALAFAPSLGLNVPTKPFINVSVGLKGDPHVRKAIICADRCSTCGQCVKNCEQLAIESGTPVKIIDHRCIGCGKCQEVCEFEAIEYYTLKIDILDILPKCLQSGAETLELHAVTPDDCLVMQDWQTIVNILPDQFVSMCLDRSMLSNEHLMRRIQGALEIAGDKQIIQADGAPMSGGKDNYNTTLQAVAIADIIQKSKLPVKILLSGGTNSKSCELASLCNLHVHGVSIGTYARSLVREEINDPNFNNSIIARAAKKAKWLVDSNIKYIRRE